jgi:hypothetical protein
VGSRKREKASEETEFVWEVMRGGRPTGEFLKPGDWMWLKPFEDDPYYPSGAPLRVPVEIVECADSLGGLFTIRCRGAHLFAPVRMLEYGSEGPGFLPRWEGPIEGLVLSFGDESLPCPGASS